MAGRRREAFEAQHADRGFRAHSAVVGLSGVGLGDGGQCPGPGVLEEVWIRDRAERAYSSDDAENRRQRHFSYGSFNRVSAATARQSGFAGTDESASRPTQERPGNYGRQLRSRATRAGGRGFFARVSENFLNQEIKSNLKKVAVGTGIAPRPPHGPGRARLTHPVLIAERMGTDRGSHEHPL